MKLVLGTKSTAVADTLRSTGHVFTTEPTVTSHADITKAMDIVANPSPQSSGSTACLVVFNSRMTFTSAHCNSRLPSAAARAEQADGNLGPDAAAAAHRKVSATRESAARDDSADHQERCGRGEAAGGSCRHGMAHLALAVLRQDHHCHRHHQPRHRTHCLRVAPPSSSAALAVPKARL
eukprot:1372280-Rhodomonas_salina.1